MQLRASVNKSDRLLGMFSRTLRLLRHKKAKVVSRTSQGYEVVIQHRMEANRQEYPQRLVGDKVPNIAIGSPRTTATFPGFFQDGLANINIKVKSRHNVPLGGYQQRGLPFRQQNNHSRRAENSIPCTERILGQPPRCWVGQGALPQSATPRDLGLLGKETTVNISWGECKMELNGTVRTFTTTHSA